MLLASGRLGVNSPDKKGHKVKCRQPVELEIWQFANNLVSVKTFRDYYVTEVKRNLKPELASGTFRTTRKLYARAGHFA
jgi:hypothetical protein